MHEPDHSPLNVSANTYVCVMETESFTFLAVGRTRDESVHAMVETMRRHRRQYQPGDKPWMPEDYAPEVDGAARPDGDDERWLRWVAINHYGASVVGPLTYGCAGARDNEVLPGPGPHPGLL